MLDGDSFYKLKTLVNQNNHENHHETVDDNGDSLLDAGGEKIDKKGQPKMGSPIKAYTRSNHGNPYQDEDRKCLAAIERKVEDIPGENPHGHKGKHDDKKGKEEVNFYALEEAIDSVQFIIKGFHR